MLIEYMNNWVSYIWKDRGSFKNLVMAAGLERGEFKGITVTTAAATERFLCAQQSARCSPHDGIYVQ